MGNHAMTELCRMEFEFYSSYKNIAAVDVTPGRMFSAENGSAVEYGFLNHEENTSAYGKIPEINDGFEIDSRFLGRKICALSSDENGTVADYDGAGTVPVSFAYKVESSGNYLVEVKILASKDAKEVTVFQSRRRLAKVMDLKAGERKTLSFIVNVSPIIPRYHTEVFEDKSVNFSVLGAGVYVCEAMISKWDGPTAYIVGDSTVTDQTGTIPYLPERCYSGWGQMLSGFMGTDMAVSNHAHSGLTTESFRNEGHYDNLRPLIKEGDYCLLQFGHNDQKIDALKADTGYRNNLVNYIEEIRSMGATPVIISPLARNTWKGNGEYNDLLSDYARVCEEVSQSMGVKYIDLHMMSMEFVKKLGVERAKAYFYPSDYTHTNDYGAYLFAGYIYEELTGKDIPSYKYEPSGELRSVECEGDYDEISTDEGLLLKDIERPEDCLKRFEALDFAIQTLKYFPTNVYNDMFTDVVGHEVYAGIVECAYQNGIIPDEWLEGDKLYPAKEVTEKEFFGCLQKGVLSRNGRKLEAKEIKPEDDSLIKRKNAVNWCRIVREKI